MAYHYDPYDKALVIDGWENGIGDSPHKGLSDMRNCNIISIPGEACVNFSTVAAAPPPTYGEVTVTGVGSNTLTFSGGMANLLNGSCLYFTSVGSLTGVSANTPYWAYNVNGVINSTVTTSCQLYSSYATSNAVTIGGSATGAKFRVISFGVDQQIHGGGTAGCNYMAFDASGYNNIYFVLDMYGLVWSNMYLTSDSALSGNAKFWTCMGMTGTSDTGYPKGLAYYQGNKTDGTGKYLFVFNSGSIDYFNFATGAWVWGWRPSDAATHTTNYLHSSTTGHMAMVAPDSKLYFCDGSWVSGWYQTDPNTVFDPSNKATYTYFQQTALMPATDTAQCLGYLGSNILIGGKNNIVYSWDGYSTGSSWIILPEYSVSSMVTVNTNTYIFAGNRGRIYTTNGVNAVLFKKVPDHISGTIEPYFTWGATCSYKNQIYFSFNTTTNAGTVIGQYGGIWAIDLDTKALRLTNKLSQGSYYAYASSMIPNFTSSAAGTGFFAAWIGTLTGNIYVVTTNGSNTLSGYNGANVFNPYMVGAAVYGTNIPNGSYIMQYNSPSSVTLNTYCTGTSSPTVQVIINMPIGLDATQSTPYINSEAIIDTDLVPIGTYQKPKDMTTVEYKLAKPLVNGESISIQARLLFDTQDTGYTTIFTDNTTGNFSGKADFNFANAQWVQFKIILNSVASSPSYVRLKNIRILGVTEMPV